MKSLSSLAIPPTPWASRALLRSEVHGNGGAAGALTHGLSDRSAAPSAAWTAAMPHRAACASTHPRRR